MDYLNRVFAILESYADLETRDLPNGTRLVGRAIHIAPEAWLHQIYAPLDGNGIAQVEATVGMRLPKVLTAFYLRANGLRLFSGHLYLEGLRANFARTIEAVWQPFSIALSNGPERPRNARPHHLFIGGYEPYGSLIYMDTTTEKTYLCGPRSIKPLYEWPSFEVMLESETERLSRCFDRRGCLIDPKAKTIPKPSG